MMSRVPHDINCKNWLYKRNLQYKINILIFLEHWLVVIINKPVLLLSDVVF